MGFVKNPAPGTASSPFIRQWKEGKEGASAAFGGVGDTSGMKPWFITNIITEYIR